MRKLPSAACPMIAGIMLAICVTFPAVAQSLDSGADLDSLFEDSGAGTTGDKTSGAGSSSVMADLVTKRSLDFSISLVSMAVGALGWADWPLVGNFTDVEAAAGFGGTLRAGFDARPGASIRIHGYAEYEIPSSAFALKELFADRDFANAIFLRAGKQVIGWGRGNIFKIGDLLDITDDSTAGAFALKVFVPAGKAGVTGVAYYEPVTEPAYSLANANGAFKLEYAAGRTGFDFAGLLHGDGSACATAGAGTSILGADLFVETRTDFSAWTPAWKGATAGFVKEWSDPRLVLTGEYRYKADAAPGEIPAGHYAALAAGWRPKSRLSFKIGLQWLHCTADGSGSVAALLRATPFAGVDAELAIPFSYGEAGSAYGLKLPANWDLPLSWDKRLSAILKISTTVSY